MTDTIEDVIQDVENWLGFEEKKVVAFFKPIIADIVAAGKADLLQDVITDAPAVAAAYSTGGVAAAEASIVGDGAQLISQGKALAATTVTAIAAAVVASAQSASSASGTATPAS